MSEFFSQGGYAFYVWTAYGLTCLLLCAEVIQLRHQYRTILRRLRRWMRMNLRGKDQ